MVNRITNLFAEGKVVYTDGGVLAEFAWVLVVLPFVAASVRIFLLLPSGIQLSIQPPFMILGFNCLIKIDE